MAEENRAPTVRPGGDEVGLEIQRNYSRLMPQIIRRRVAKWPHKSLREPGRRYHRHNRHYNSPEHATGNGGRRGDAS